MRFGVGFVFGVFGNTDLDLVIENADFVFADVELGLGTVEPGSFPNAEFPGVPGADDTAVLDVTGRERCSHVGTDVVDGGVVIVDEEEGDESALDAEGAAFACGDIADFGDGFKIGHRGLSEGTNRRD